MLARHPLRQRLAALACAGWVTACEGFQLAPDPLAPGMTPRDAANSLRSSLSLVTSAAGTAVYVADRQVAIAGLGSVTERTFLQFRGGALLGWNSAWWATSR
jgi:hypothetical protein